MGFRRSKFQGRARLSSSAVKSSRPSEGTRQDVGKQRRDQGKDFEETKTYSAHPGPLESLAEIRAQSPKPNPKGPRTQIVGF